MRRRLRSATFPLHRHSLAQLAIDAVIVAVSYELAYRLRFDNGRIPPRFDRLLDATLPWVVVLALVVFTLFRLETKQWRYTGHRDFVTILQAVVVATLVVAGYVAFTHPVTVTSRSSGEVAVTTPTGVLALFLLLMWLLVAGARFVARVVYEQPLKGFRG